MTQKKTIEDALKKAKELELHEPMPPEQVVDVYKEGMNSLEKFKKLLTNEWFMKDVHKKNKKKSVVKKQKLRTRRKNKKNL